MLCTPRFDQDDGCPHRLFCSALRAYVIDREAGGEDDGNWCPRAAAHRGAVARAGVTLPRADGTFAPAEIAAANGAAAAASREGPCITLGEITGWRIWLVRDGYLLSPLRETVWPSDGFVAGDPGAGFGIFAFKEPHRSAEEARRMSSPGLTIAYGAVRIWGEVAEHRRGYRAQFARIATVDGVHPADHQLGEVCRRYGLEAPV